MHPKAESGAARRLLHPHRPPPPPPTTAPRCPLPPAPLQHRSTLHRARRRFRSPTTKPAPCPPPPLPYTAVALQNAGHPPNPPRPPAPSQRQSPPDARRQSALSPAPASTAAAPCHRPTSPPPRAPKLPRAATHPFTPRHNRTPFPTPLRSRKKTPATRPVPTSVAAHRFSSAPNATIDTARPPLQLPPWPPPSRRFCHPPSVTPLLITFLNPRAPRHQSPSPATRHRRCQNTLITCRPPTMLRVPSTKFSKP